MVGAAAELAPGYVGVRCGPRHVPTRGPPAACDFDRHGSDFDRRVLRPRRARRRWRWWRVRRWRWRFLERLRRRRRRRLGGREHSGGLVHYGRKGGHRRRRPAALGRSTLWGRKGRRSDHDAARVQRVRSLRAAAVENGRGWQRDTGAAPDGRARRGVVNLGRRRRVLGQVRRVSGAGGGRGRGRRRRRRAGGGAGRLWRLHVAQLAREPLPLAADRRARGVWAHAGGVDGGVQRRRGRGAVGGEGDVFLPVRRYCRHGGGLPGPVPRMGPPPVGFPRVRHDEGL